MIRILVIEDEIKIYDTLRFQAEKEEVEFAFAENGQEGLKKLREDGPFSAVLLDLHMPGTDGFWFLGEKDKDASLGNIPVIIFTNLSDPDLVKRAVALGVKGYLIKAHHGIAEIVREAKKCASNETCIIDDVTRKSQA